MIWTLVFEVDNKYHEVVGWGKDDIAIDGNTMDDRWDYGLDGNVHLYNFERPIFIMDKGTGEIFTKRCELDG